VACWERHSRPTPYQQQRVSAAADLGPGAGRSSGAGPGGSSCLALCGSSCARARRLRRRRSSAVRTDKTATPQLWCRKQGAALLEGGRPGGQSWCPSVPLAGGGGGPWQLQLRHPAGCVLGISAEGCLQSICCRGGWRMPAEGCLAREVVAGVCCPAAGAAALPADGGPNGDRHVGVRLGAGRGWWGRTPRGSTPSKWRRITA